MNSVNFISNIDVDKSAVTIPTRENTAQRNIHEDIKQLKTMTELNGSYNSYKSYKNITQLNNDLLCPLNIENNHNEDKNIGFMNILKDIYSKQYTVSCNPTKQKFYIWKHNINVGIFANLNIMAFHLAHALLLNRTFLIYGEWTFYDAEKCKLNITLHSSMECFFMSLSNCTINDILYTQNKNVTISTEPTTLHQFHVASKYDTINNSFDIIHLPNAEYYQLYPVFFRNAKWLQNYYNSSTLSVFEFRSVLQSYIFRMNPDVSNIVNAIVKQNYHSHDVSADDMQNTVSMIIRWGDKCLQTGSRLAETYCTTYQQMMSGIKELVMLEPNLKHIIATSDTKSIISNLTNDYKQWISEKNMSLIIDKYDIMPDTSLQKKYKTEENIYLVIISILSAIKLHFGSKYFIIGSKSNWARGIVDIASHLDCKPTLNDDTIKAVGNRYVIEFKGNNLKRIQDKLVPVSTDVVLKWPRQLSEIYIQSNFSGQSWDKRFNLTNIWDTI